MISFALRATVMATACIGLMASQPVFADPRDGKSGDDVYQPSVGQGGKDVIWVPTPDDLIEQMLKTAQIKPEDIVYDLGAGDGKIAIAAARDFGATAFGIEYNPDMAALAQRNANRAGVGDKVKIINGDIFVEDFSKASVVTLYLLPTLNLKLRPIILDMKPGTRVVSNSFDMGDWDPDQRLGTEYTRGYYWVVPAKVQGTWRLSGTDVSNAEIVLNQRYQNVGGTITIAGKTQPLLSPKLSGDNLSFRFINELGNHRIAELKVAGDRMAGRLLENHNLGDITAEKIK